MIMLVEISDDLYGKLLDMKKENLLDLMLNALDEMQSFNGQTVTSAIMRATGAEETYDENGNARWKLKGGFK
jgi:predicted CopG family antitoxin